MQHLEQRQLFTQHLTPLLKQSLDVLQMGQAELDAYLGEQALENPLIDLDSFTPVDSYYPPLQRHREYLGSQTAEDLLNCIADKRIEASLLDYLTSQVNSCPSLPVERAVIMELLEQLDDNGYFSPSFQVIMRESARPLNILLQARTFIQSLDPPGVGASSLTECLLLQMDESDTLARKIVQLHLDSVASDSLGLIAEELGANMEQVKQAVIRIKRLSPKPGQNFQNYIEPIYIVPDVTVINTPEHGLEAILNHPGSARINIHPHYLDMLKRTNDKELREYLQNKLAQLKHLRRCLDNRSSTLQRVVDCILLYQERFFSYGPTALSCLQIKDCARILGLHESTVSRTIAGKHLSCSYGTFPLKYFFVRRLRPDAPDTSALDVKEKIASLISREDTYHPMSDQAIALELSRLGLPISRRTVAKYREELGILNSSRRHRKYLSS